MNLARLNHILIPATKSERDRLRRTRFGRIVSDPVTKTYYALSKEGRALFLFTAIAGFAGLDVMRSQNSTLWALLFSLIVASLAVRRLFGLRGVSIRVVGPERVMAGEEARFEVCLENRSDRARHSVRLDGPFLPWDGSWRSPAPSIQDLPPGESRRATLVARFDARGAHEIDSFSASALVPLRLALGPRLWSTGTRFVVVPRMANVRALQLASSPRYQPGGVALASRSGESMELVGVRPYRDGDRIRDLHAKTWARTGEPAVREYHQEYFSRVGVVLDTDRTHASENQLEAGISLAAGVIARLSRGEAVIDLLVTGDQLHPLTLGRSLGTLDQALDHLACVEAGPVLDSMRITALLNPYLSCLSSLIFISLGWDDERSSLARAIEQTGVGCRTLGVLEPRREGGQVPPDFVRVLKVAEIQAACQSDRGLEL